MAGWIILALRIIFGIILALVIGGMGLFGYIAWRARAKKWGTGLFGIAIISILIFYYIILGNPWNIIPI